MLRRFYQQDGRRFLEESALLKLLAPALESLPEARVDLPSSNRRRFDLVRLPAGIRDLAGFLRPGRNTVLPAPNLLSALVRPASGIAELAVLANRKADQISSEPGLVLDWSYINSLATPFTFADGQTYFVTNAVVISGTQAVTDLTSPN